MHRPHPCHNRPKYRNCKGDGHTTYFCDEILKFLDVNKNKEKSELTDWTEKSLSKNKSPTTLTINNSSNVVLPTVVGQLGQKGKVIKTSIIISLS